MTDLLLCALQYNNTPLHYAVQSGVVDCVDRLLVAGAEVDAREKVLHFVRWFV